LHAANQRLNKLVSEREMLLSEVNHRAKNSLAVAASLLAIQGRRQPDRAVRALFEEAQDRLHAMARVPAHSATGWSTRSGNEMVTVRPGSLCTGHRP
jgi:two-component sensor histidine kinase